MSLPKHLAIIMDGNGRWAKQRSRPRTFGHIKGARVAKQIITACAEKGLCYLTLYAFSSENWLRPHAEVSFLMNLLRRYLKRETATLVKQNIRFKVIGEPSRVPTDLQEALTYTTKATENCTGMTLLFAVSYGSRQEIADAVRKIAMEVRDETLSIDEIDEAAIHTRLSTFPAPDPDLIIRTSGESRLSNFLLWQAAYSEFYFSKTLWPDFTIDDLNAAFADFADRERRFGGVSNHAIRAH